jgi:hypothetical protein
VVSSEVVKEVLARIIHERFMGLCSAHRKTDEYAGKVAESLHYQLDTLKIEFPLFINKTRLREYFGLRKLPSCENGPQAAVPGVGEKQSRLGRGAV